MECLTIDPGQTERVHEEGVTIHLFNHQPACKSMA